MLAPALAMVCRVLWSTQLVSAVSSSSASTERAARPRPSVWSRSTRCRCFLHFVLFPASITARRRLHGPSPLFVHRWAPSRYLLCGVDRVSIATFPINKRRPRQPSILTLIMIGYLTCCGRECVRRRRTSDAATGGSRGRRLRPPPSEPFHRVVCGAQWVGPPQLSCSGDTRLRRQQRQHLRNKIRGPPTVINRRTN